MSRRKVTRREDVILFAIAAIVLIFIIAVFAWSAEGADVTLSWDAPTLNEDGTPLTDLAGFKFYTHSGDTYTEIADVAAGETSTLLTMPAGEYCFVGTAYDTPGNESINSNEVCTDLMAPATYQITIEVVR